MSGSSQTWKQVLLTVVVTGFVTVVAGIITYYLTVKVPALTYSVSEGPMLPVRGEYKQIYLFEVRNTGSGVVESVVAQAALTEGTIDETAFQGSPGLRPLERKEPTLYEVEIPDLNEKEQFTVSLMLTLFNTNARPKFSVRGKGVVGELADERALGSQKTVVIPLIVGAMAAALGMILSVTPFLRKLIKAPGITPLARVFYSTESTVGPFDRNELVAYIAARCGLGRESAALRFAPAEVTFRGAADYLLGEGLNVSGQERRAYCTALKCMLLIGEMTDESRDVVKRAIGLLVGDDKPEQLDAILLRAVDQESSPAQLRDEIDRLVVEESDNA